MKALVRSLLFIVMLPLSAALAAPTWNLVLPDTAVVSENTALLKDVAREAVPAAAADLVLHASGRPGTTAWISRQGVLRRLVSAGLATGVRMLGAERCLLVFTGRELNAETLRDELRRLVQVLVPPAADGAPDSWYALEITPLRLAARGPWTIELERRQPLRPGRNLLRAAILDGGHREVVPVTVILHCYGETSTVLRRIDRDAPLDASQFAWAWSDLAEIPSGLAVGRTCLDGSSAARTIAAGESLRASDLKSTPMIMAGDPVELRVARGGVSVTVRAYARQPGCLGQTIPVRNQLTGRLVNARVAGPGLVEWRR